MGARVWLHSGASLRGTDEGVRPYVIFGDPPQWYRSLAPPDGRGRPSLRDFLWSSTVGAELRSAGRTGRPSIRDSKACRVHLLFNRQIQVLNLECTLCL